MRWQEPAEIDQYKAPRNVVDIAFRIRCRRLPLDHAHELLQAIAGILPWLPAEPETGIHTIHGAESGNGWYRPDENRDEYIQLSRRVRLVLRAPQKRVAQCIELCGKTLTVSSHEIVVENYKMRQIKPSPTLFSRRVLTAPEESEDAFIERVHRDLQNSNIDAPKLLSGRLHQINTPARQLIARSLLLADISIPDSVRIQEKGLGSGRKLGCGLFVPHKSIDAVE